MRVLSELNPALVIFLSSLGDQAGCAAGSSLSRPATGLSIGAGATSGTAQSKSSCGEVAVVGVDAIVAVGGLGLLVAGEWGWASSFQLSWPLFLFMRT
jgi:hypothetical protein